MDQAWLIEKADKCFGKLRQRDLDFSANRRLSSVYAVSYSVVAASDLFRATGDEEYAGFSREVCANWGRHLPIPVLGESNESDSLKGCLAMAHASRCLIAGGSTGKVGKIMETLEKWLEVFIPARISAYESFGHYDKVSRAGYSAETLDRLGRKGWKEHRGALVNILDGSVSDHPFWWFENLTNDVAHRSDTVHWFMEYSHAVGENLAAFFNRWIVKDSAALWINTWPGVYAPDAGLPIDDHHKRAIVSHGWPKLAAHNADTKAFFDSLITEVMYQLENQNEPPHYDIGRHKDWRRAMTMIGGLLT